MKGIVQNGFGEPSEVLTVTEVDPPVVADDEVLVRVHAASIHNAALAGMGWTISGVILFLLAGVLAFVQCGGHWPIADLWRARDRKGSQELTTSHVARPTVAPQTTDEGANSLVRAV
ncbi:MAG: hypothetical protein WBZ45_13090 [Acidimicrobiia bacterium]